jgi:hypothetical protein
MATAISISWLPRCLRGSDRDESKTPALVWLEQKRPGVFARRTLSMGSPRHATLDVGDLEGDGDVDIVVGVMTPDNKAGAWVEVWENQCADFSKSTRLRAPGVKDGSGRPNASKPTCH